MAAVNRKRTALPEARALYETGATYAAIAESLKVPAGSIRRWGVEEGKAGRPWTRKDEPAVGATARRGLAVPTQDRGQNDPHAQASPGHGTLLPTDAHADETPAAEAPAAETPDPPKDRAELCRRLEHRLGLLVVQAEDNLADAKVEERFLKLCRVLESLRADSADLDALVEAMGQFAEFCMKNLTEEEMAPVRGPIRQFLDYLKEEHS